MYRGFDHAIKDTSSVDVILKQTKLDWKVCELPILIQGNKENRLFPGRKAIVRCDTGAPIEVVSDSFKVHQNTDIVGEMVNAAGAGGIQLTSGGSLNNGAVVFLHGTKNRQFDAGESKKKGDIVRLDFRLTGGHRPGTPRKLMAVAMRLVCLNGMCVAANTGVISTSHRKSLNSSDSTKMATFIEDAIAGFETFEEKAKRLMGFKFTREMTQGFVLELLQPKFKQDLKAVAGKDFDDAVRGKFLLDDILAKYPTELKIGRTSSNVLENVENQPGVELARGTAWNAFNAVTNFVDHKRGYTEEGVISQFAGDGATMKNRALDLIVEYTERYR
jgi:phage/plasmid-like protein (TIGR03299 family)